MDHMIDPNDEHGGDDGTAEGWGSPEDLAAVVEHVQSTPFGIDPWGLEDEQEALPRAASRTAENGKSSEQTRHEVGRFHAPENHPAESWQDCPQCSWYGLGDAHNWKPDEEQDPFDPRLIGASRDPLLAGVKDVLSYSASVVREAFPAPEGHFDDQWKEKLMEAINDPETGGGFTIRERPGDGPTSGTMVSLPRSEGHEESDLTRDEVSGDNQADYMDRKWDAIQDHRDNYGGGWDDKGRWYNDVSRNFVDPWEAAMFAVSGDQKGVFDLDGYYHPEGHPNEVTTSQFFHDQIAKGGSRRARRDR